MSDSSKSTSICERRNIEDELFGEVIRVCLRYEYLLEDWQNLISQLGLGEEFIDSILRDTGKPIKDRVFRAFERWRMWRGGNITSVCKDLEKALRKMKLTRIAEDVTELCTEALGDTYMVQETLLKHDVLRQDQNIHKGETGNIASGSETSELSPRKTSTTDLFRPKTPRPYEANKEWQCEKKESRTPPAGSALLSRSQEKVTIHPPPNICASTRNQIQPTVLLHKSNRHDNSASTSAAGPGENLRLSPSNFAQAEFVELPKTGRSHLPVDMAELPDRRLVVCDHHNECLYILSDINGSFTTQRIIRGKDSSKLQKPLRVAAWREHILVSCSGSKIILVYSPLSDALVACLDVHMDPLALAVYGDTLYVGGNGRIVSFCLTKTQKRIMCLKETTYFLNRQDGIVQYLACGYNGHLFATTGWTTNELYMWHVGNPKPIAVGKNLGDPQGLAVIDGVHLLLAEWRLGTIIRLKVQGNAFSPQIESIVPSDLTIVRPTALHFHTPYTIIVVSGEERKLSVFRKNPDDR